MKPPTLRWTSFDFPHPRFYFLILLRKEKSGYTCLTYWLCNLQNYGIHFPHTFRTTTDDWGKKNSAKQNLLSMLWKVNLRQIIEIKKKCVQIIIETKLAGIRQWGKLIALAKYECLPNSFQILLCLVVFALFGNYFLSPMLFDIPSPGVLLFAICKTIPLCNECCNYPFRN